ncbi:MAG: polyprenyl synthetase family protein [Prevotella sp.]|nr:polyprenyl synthetase family protein [Prevotella sp.]MCM1075499.1 polyprenyl synthetase family protein [Ruminococcus sp.]
MQISFTDIAEALKPELQALNVNIRRALNSDDTPLMNEIVERYLQTKGKQVRPIMVMLCAGLFSEVNDTVIHAATALELLHNASLIHDDVVDETKKRRGRDTVNAIWDNHIAVLVGDFFVSAALAEAVRTDMLAIVSSLSALGKELSQGEIHQICNARGHSFRIEDYFTAIHKKTASLFLHCALVGAEACGVDRKKAEPLLHFAEKLGLCFQIRDDIFDYFPSGLTGKPSGNDLRENKVTLPLLLALRNAPTPLANEMKALLQNDLPDENQIRRLIEFTHANGGIEAAYAEMERLHAEALPLLDAYPQSEAREMLRALFAFIISRNS